MFRMEIFDRVWPSFSMFLDYIIAPLHYYVCVVVIPVRLFCVLVTYV